MNSCMIVLLLSGLVLTHGVIQQIELYYRPYMNGSYFVLKDKVTDLTDWKFFLANVTSYCAIGRWFFFTETNFDGMPSSYKGIWEGYEERECGNSEAFPRHSSARFWGPADTRTIAISIYEGIHGSVIGGTELVVEGRAATNFPMNTTAYVVSHGGADWTLFTEDNFEGTKWCFHSYGNISQELTLNATHPVRSVVRDCDSQSVSLNIHEYKMGIIK